MSDEEKEIVKESKKDVTKAARKAAVKTAEKVVYIGPSIKHVIATGTVLTNGLPEKLEQEVVRRPEIRSLIVPVDYLSDALKELKKGGSGLDIIYKKVEEE